MMTSFLFCFVLFTHQETEAQRSTCQSLNFWVTKPGYPSVFLPHMIEAQQCQIDKCLHLWVPSMVPGAGIQWGTEQTWPPPSCDFHPGYRWGHTPKTWMCWSHAPLFYFGTTVLPGENTGSGSKHLGFEFRLRHLLTVCTWQVSKPLWAWVFSWKKKGSESIPVSKSC